MKTLTAYLAGLRYIPDEKVVEGPIEIFLSTQGMTYQYPGLYPLVFNTNNDIYSFQGDSLVPKISTIKSMFVDTSKNSPGLGIAITHISIPPFNFVIPGGFTGFIPLFINMPVLITVTMTGSAGSGQCSIILYNFKNFPSQWNGA